MYMISSTYACFPPPRFEPPLSLSQKSAKLKATSKCWLKELAFLFDSTGIFLMAKYIYNWGCYSVGVYMYGYVWR